MPFKQPIMKINFSTATLSVMMLAFLFVITLHLDEFTLAPHFPQAFSCSLVANFSLANICEIISAFIPQSLF